MTHNWKPKRDPWLPPDYDDHVVYAVRNLSRGSATETQQKLIWEWLAYVGGVGDEWQDLTYRPGAAGDRDSAFASGKQFAVLSLRKMLHPALDPKPEQQQKLSDNPAQPFEPAAYRRRRQGRSK